MSVTDIVPMSVTDVKRRYHAAVTRWPPDSRARLEAAALELYLEQGFDETTVAEIAARAGLTERTFFRYIADKREVLFGGAGLMAEALTAAVAASPAEAAPMEAVVEALASLGPLFDGRQELVLRRQVVIDSHTELRARELVKLESLSATLTEALTRRGVPAGPARLAATAGLAAFRVAFQNWIDDGGRSEMAALIRRSAAELRSVAAGL